MKMYNKSNLTIINGLLVSGEGDIVVVDPEIVRQANELETMLQKSKYLADQPSAQPAPSLDGFERESSFKSSKFTVVTPVMDFKVAEAMALMDEIDDMAAVEKANAMVDDFQELIRFTQSEHVIDTNGSNVVAFDTPLIGSVLELTEEDVSKVIALACGMASIVDGSDDSDGESE